MTPRSEPEWQEPGSILRRIVAELALCRGMLHRLEAEMGPHLSGLMSADTLGAVQDIDRLGQTLADLETCLGLLAGEIDGTAAIDTRPLLQAMRLDDLARRLGGLPVRPVRADTRIALF